MSKGGIDWVLKNRFYIGEFGWGGEIYAAPIRYSSTGRRSNGSRVSGPPKFGRKGPSGAQLSHESLHPDSEAALRQG